MRVLIATAALGAACVLMPAIAGHAPARSQDFSITNPEPPPPAGSRRDILRQLQAWWDIHAYYPNRAAQSDESGTVAIRLVILADGRIGTITVQRSSGSLALDDAALTIFAGGYIKPAPEGTPDTPITLTLRYILTRRHDQKAPPSGTAEPAKAPFSITNDPVTPPILAKMLLKTCTGKIVVNGLRNHPLRGIFYDSKLVFYREADGTPWVKFYEVSRMSQSPIVQVGNLVSWTGPASGHSGDSRSAERRLNHYTAWLDTDGKLDGCISSDDRWQVTASCEGATGTLAFSCERETVPQVQPDRWSTIPNSEHLDSPRPASTPAPRFDPGGGR